MVEELQNNAAVSIILLVRKKTRVS